MGYVQRITIKFNHNSKHSPNIINIQIQIHGYVVHIENIIHISIRVRVSHHECSPNCNQLIAKKIFGLRGVVVIITLSDIFSMMSATTEDKH